MVSWNQIIMLLPILIIGSTVVIIMLSISYRRNQFRHALLSMIGLSTTVIVLLNMIWKNDGIQEANQLIYIDNSSVFYMILIIISSITSGLSAYSWLLRYPNNHRDEFYLLLLISSMGGILLIISNHLILLFLGIELISLPLLGLISYAVFEKSAITASIKYIILSGTSSAFLLFGIALIYADTSCLSFFDIKEVLIAHKFDEQGSSKSVSLVMIGVIMMIVGFGFKLSSVPFHLWTPDVYQGAPSVVSMYLATSSKISIISILIRFLSILPEQYHNILCIFLSGSACCSMLFGSIIAIQQRHVKRILAYSSITSSGYLLVGLIASYTDYAISQEAIGIYLINYLFSNVGAFGVINLIFTVTDLNKEKETDILLYQGLFWREPILSVMFTIIILSLAGIPMTLGFIGKFYLLLVGINNQLWILSIFILISSIISVFFYLKMIANLYISFPTNYKKCDSNFSYNIFQNATGIVVIVMTINIIIFGLYPEPMIQLIRLVYEY